MCEIWKKKRSAEMTIAEIRGVFRELGTIRGLRISGGEPFLRRDLAEIINAANRIVLPRMIHLTSNGLETKQICETVRAIEKTDNLHIKISIDDVGERNDAIRGVQGGYERALNTVKALLSLRRERPFYLGVAQTLSHPDQLTDELPAVCRSLGVGLHQVLAYDFCPLYGNEAARAAKAYQRYGREEAKRFLAFMYRHLRLSDVKENLAKKYYLHGLENRLLRGESRPNPRCAALTRHLRLLPNGDVPICLYYPEVVGNLLREGLEALWFGEPIKAHRRKVRDCAGCWAGCEVIANAVFSGDILRAFFYRSFSRGASAGLQASCSA
jgi:MoaA/NifB/PqqE/SkfB family radical SAM enzyme